MRLRFESLETRNLLAGDIDVIEAVGTNNIVIADAVAYAAAGEAGLLVVDLESREVANTVPPPTAPSSDSIDDVAYADGFLFTIDGSRPGHLSVFSTADPFAPVLVAGPVRVDVGPFAGVSAAAGRVVVSGGTGRLSVLAYDEAGNLGADIATADFGVGQPDVLISTDGEVAFVSTDFSGRVDGERFGLTVIDLVDPPVAPPSLVRIGIPGAGFTAGVDGPANFPIESAQRGDILFVASGEGISVFDVSNPSLTTLVDTIELATNPVNVDVLGDQLFVVGREPQPTLSIIDITDLASPTIETIELPENSEPLSVAAGGRLLTIAAANLGVLVYEIETELPPLLGDIDGDGVVAFSDFLVLSENFGRDVVPDTNGDLDGDGQVTFEDFLLLAGNFGATSNR